MSNWTAITTADLEDTKAASFVDALRESALGDTQDDPVEEIIADVISRIRAEIKGCPNNQLDTDTTKIPASLKSLACRMIVRQMQSRLFIDLSEDERSEKRDDLRYLERIQKCDVPVEEPDSLADDNIQSKSISPKIEVPTRYFDRTSQEGI